MELKDLKKSLFGFNRNSVMEYIAQLNHVCAEQTEEVRREKADALAELSRKNQELSDRTVMLETELDALKQQLLAAETARDTLAAENDELRAGTDARRAVEAEVADILSEAQRFARELRDKTEAEDAARRLENQQAADAERQRVADYRRRVSAVRDQLVAVLSATQRELEQTDAGLSALEGDADAYRR